MTITRLLIIEDELTDAGLAANEFILALSTAREPNGCCPVNPVETAAALREATSKIRALTLEKFGIYTGLLDNELAKDRASVLCGKQLALLDAAEQQYESFLAEQWI